MNTIISINEAILLLEDGEFRRSFLIEFHKYLKDKLSKDQVNEDPKVCSFDRSCTRCNSFKHFDKFCMSRGMHPDVAHGMLRLMYGECMGCDWDYFQNLKATEEDPEPPRIAYLKIEGR